MMNKTPSTKPELFKFLFALPLMALLLLACRDNTDAHLADLEKAGTSQTDAQKGIQPAVPPPPPPLEAELAPPPPPPVPVEVAIQNEKFDWDTFFNRNPNIKSFSPILQNNSIVSGVVTLNSGKIEEYNFKDKSDLERFQQRYGDIKLKNPPPPPPPVVSPAQ